MAYDNNRCGYCGNECGIGTKLKCRQCHELSLKAAVNDENEISTLRHRLAAMEKERDRAYNEGLEAAANEAENGWHGDITIRIRALRREVSK